MVELITEPETSYLYFVKLSVIWEQDFKVQIDVCMCRGHDGTFSPLFNLRIKQVHFFN